MRVINMNKLPDKLDDYNEARKRGFLKVKALKDKGVMWCILHIYSF